MFSSPYHRRLPVAYLNRVIEASFRHGQLKMYYNFRGEPIGYIVWAYLDELSESQILESGQWDVHISEWNEGKSLWIVDLLAPFGHARMILRDFRINLVQEEKSVRFLRFRNGMVEAREVRFR